MPNLRSLTLIHESEPLNDDRLVDPFGPSVPALTRLSLVHIPLYPALLRLRTLTDLAPRNYAFNLYFDTLLDFLEEDNSLECLNLCIGFARAVLRSSRRLVSINNHLHSLTVLNAVDGNALISNIALQKCAHIGFTIYHQATGLNNLPSVIYSTHLP